MGQALLVALSFFWLIHSPASATAVASTQVNALKSEVEALYLETLSLSIENSPQLHDLPELTEAQFPKLTSVVQSVEAKRDTGSPVPYLLLTLKFDHPFVTELLILLRSLPIFVRWGNQHIDARFLESEMRRFRLQFAAPDKRAASWSLLKGHTQTQLQLARRVVEELNQEIDDFGERLLARMALVQILYGWSTSTTSCLLPECHADLRASFQQEDSQRRLSSIAFGLSQNFLKKEDIFNVLKGLRKIRPELHRALNRALPTDPNQPNPSSE